MGILSMLGFFLQEKRLHVFYLPPRSPEFNPDEGGFTLHLLQRCEVILLDEYCM